MNNAGNVIIKVIVEYVHRLEYILRELLSDINIDKSADVMRLSFH